MSERFYQTLAIITADGRRLEYYGKVQVDAKAVPPIVDIIVSPPLPLPAGMFWSAPVMEPKQDG